MLSETLVGFISDLGLNVIKDKLTDRHDEIKIKKDIREFADNQFETKFKHLNFESEIDFGGLQIYLNSTLITEIKLYLFDTDQALRKNYKNTIMEKAYSHAKANNKQKKDEIRLFVETVLSIIEQYYVDKLDGKYILLLNITVESLLGALTSTKEEIKLYIAQSKDSLLKAIIEVSFDKHKANESINDYFYNGDFDTVHSMLKVINNNAKDLISSIHIKLSCFCDDIVNENYINEFISLHPDSYLVNDLIEFLCVFNDEKANLSKLLPLCTQPKLTEIVNIVLEDKYTEIYTEKLDEGIISFALRDEYIDNAVALSLMAKNIYRKEHITNKHELYKSVNTLISNFYFLFIELKLQADYIINTKDIMINSKYYNELGVTLNKLLALEKSFKYCSQCRQLEFYGIVLQLIAIIRPSEFNGIYNNLPKGLMEKQEIKEFHYRYSIKTKALLNEKEIEDFCIDTRSYALLYDYLRNVKKDYNAIYNFLADHLFLVKSELIVLELYIECICKIKSNSEATIELEKYSQYYKDAAGYYVIYLGLSSKSENTDIAIDKMLTLIMKSGLHLHLIKQASYVLFDNNRVADAISLLNKYSVFSDDFKFLLAEFLYFSNNEENMQQSKAIIDELMLSGYENHKIFEIKASMLVNEGFQLEALKCLEKSYLLKKDSLNILLNILCIRINNLKCKEDEILLSAKRVEHTYAQYFVALNYFKIGNESAYNFHIKKALLLCTNYDEQIFLTYINKQLMEGTSDKKINLDIVSTNSAIFLKDIISGKIIHLCIHDNSEVLPTEKTNFAEAIHLTFKDIKSTAFLRRKVGEHVILDDSEYEIIEILDIDVFLVRYCLEKLCESGIVTAMHMDINDLKPTFDELLEMINRGNASIAKILKMYTAPSELLPIPINFLSTKTTKTYIETLLHLILNNDIIFWNNPYESVLYEKSKIIVSYNTIILLNLLEIDVTFIKKTNNIYISSSTKNQIEAEFKNNFNYLSRDNVSSLINNENTLQQVVYSEEDKRKSIEFNSKVFSILDALNVSENETDIEIGLFGKAEYKYVIGVFEYDSIALFSDEDTVLITDDFFISRLINIYKNSLQSTCGIIDLLVYMDIGAKKFIASLQKLKAFKFNTIISINAVKYLTRALAEIKDEDEQRIILEQLDELFLLPSDGDYRNNFIYNALYLLRCIFEQQIEVNVLLLNRLWEIATINFLETHELKITASENGITFDYERT